MQDTYGLIITDTHVLVRANDPILPRKTVISDIGIDGDTYAGTYDSIRYECLKTDMDVDDPPSGFSFVPIRSLFATLPQIDAAILAHATHVARWRNNNQFCSRCGGRNKDAEKETAATCVSCGYMSFPRISPAIIVGVVKDDALLLARNSRFVRDPPMFSIIAGFVEPGESLEMTVEREIREEVSIRVKNIRYFGSQPWPFPDSLMLGFFADYDSGQIQVDGDEIVEAAWYRPDHFPEVPPHGSISRKIIDWFVQQQTQRQ